MEETNAETITALFYEIWYLLVFSDKKKAAGYAWGLMGLTAKLAQSVSFLHYIPFRPTRANPINDFPDRSAYVFDAYTRF